MPTLNMKPNIARSAFIADGAKIIGDVRLCEDSSIWYNAVLRGDVAAITVGRRSNIQDNCTLHCDIGIPLEIGDDVTVGHNAVLHSCTVGDGSLIGMGAIVLTGAVIGKSSVVAAGSVVTSKTVVPDGSLYMGVPAKFKCVIPPQIQKELYDNAKLYVDLAAQNRQRSECCADGRCVPLKELDTSHLEAIIAMRNICEKNGTFHFKFDREIIEHRVTGEINDIFYYIGEKPAGYIGLNSIFMPSDTIELAGMVLPEYRDKGVFSHMFGAALDECRRSGAKKAVLAADAGCKDKTEFALNAGMKPCGTDILMKCKKNDWSMNDNLALTFRKAVNRDIKELAFLDMMSLNVPREQAEEFYKQPSFCNYYIAESDSRPIGKVGVLYDKGKSGRIFGLVVAPFCQRRGYGREILDYALDMIFSGGGETALLETDIENKSAQALFRSCGFRISAEFNYYEINL